MISEAVCHRCPREQRHSNAQGGGDPQPQRADTGDAGQEESLKSQFQHFPWKNTQIIMSISCRHSLLPSCQAQTPVCIPCLSTGLERFGNKLGDLDPLPRKELEEVLMVSKPKYHFLSPALVLPGPLWDAAGPIPCPAKPNLRAGRRREWQGKRFVFTSLFLPSCF